MNAERQLTEAGPSYTKLTNFVLGTGAYGKVYLGADANGVEKYAVKEFFNTTKMAEEARASELATLPLWAHGIPRSYYQEVTVMRELHCESILPCCESFVQNDTVNLVMPLVRCDLTTVFREKIRLTEAQIKRLMLDILIGLEHLHANWFIHRDLTPGNLLISETGHVLLGDFGLACEYGLSKKFNYQENVVTLWYRAPELLMNCDFYQNKVDIWALGCIFAEILADGTALFRGSDRDDQLAKIFAVLGTPEAEGCSWTHADSLVNYRRFEAREPTPFGEIFPGVSTNGLDFLACMLCLDPHKRWSASQLLEHPWLRAFPKPSAREAIIEIL